MFYGRKIGLFNLGYQLARKVDWSSQLCNPANAFRRCTLLSVLIYAVWKLSFSDKYTYMVKSVTEDV